MGGDALPADLAGAVDGEVGETVRQLDERYGYLWPPPRKASGHLAGCWRKYAGFVRVIRLYKARFDELELGEFGLEAQMELERFVQDVVAEQARAIQRACRHDHREMNVGKGIWMPSPPPLPGAREPVEGPASDGSQRWGRSVEVVGCETPAPRTVADSGGREGVAGD